jgi:Zn-dependent protease
MIFFLEEYAKSFSGMQLVAIGLAFLLAITIAITFHEFAHAFTAYKAGDLTPKSQGRLTLNPLNHISPFGMIMFVLVGFGWAKPVEVNPTKFRNYKKSMTIVTIAGIITNLGLSFLSIIIFSIIYSVGGPIESISNNLHLFAYNFFFFLAILNATLAVFNLLPIYPLDGFKLLEVHLKANNKFLTFMRQYGYLVLILLLITGVIDVILSLLVNGVLSIMFGWVGLLF